MGEAKRRKALGFDPTLYDSWQPRDPVRVCKALSHKAKSWFNNPKRMTLISSRDLTDSELLVEFDLFPLEDFLAAFRALNIKNESLISVLGQIIVCTLEESAVTDKAVHFSIENSRAFFRSLLADLKLEANS